MLDLIDPYLRRIGYTGSLAPTIETLHELVAAHVKSIPFENIDVLLGKPIALEREALVAKLVTGGRGGYCFEHNGLLLLVLEAMGFHVTPVSARVRLQRPRDFTPPRTHMFVRVEIDERPWLADVGVGALSPTAALRLDTEDEQNTPHEPRRIVREGELFFHQVRLGTQWEDVCEFTGEQMPPIDREVASWFTSAHPKSHFKNRLLVALAGDAGVRYTLLNHELTFRRADGSAERHHIETPEELVAILAEVFDIHLPAGTRLECEGLAWSSSKTA
jgi:N-hydroxyarylamine O-acetyltransferase